MSSALAGLEVRECTASNFQDCDLVFSELDSDVAGDVGTIEVCAKIMGLMIAEMEFLKADIPVFSNAKNHRRNPVVPLVVPTVNLPHLNLIPPEEALRSEKELPCL